MPLKVVKAVLPDPASLALSYQGKTCISILVKGTKGGEEREVLLFNVADHRAAFEEVGSQAISYTAGVPPVAAAMLIATGQWNVKRMVNVEELDPKPFLSLLGQMGLPSHVRDGDRMRALEENTGGAPLSRAGRLPSFAG